jgi:hypothetical protein
MAGRQCHTLSQRSAETVTYVGNIYKYYVAYRLIIEARAETDEAASKLKGPKSKP